MTVLSPEAHAQASLACLDLVDQAIDKVYELLNINERPHVTLEQIMQCEGLEPQFEYRLEVPYKFRQRFPELRLPHNFWFYSVKGLVDRVLTTGALLGGDMIVVEAMTREKADEVATGGLKRTMEIAKDLRESAIALPDVVEDPAAGLDLVSDGRRANQGAPMRGDMAEKINRMMSDTVKANQGRFAARRSKRRLH